MSIDLSLSQEELAILRRVMFWHVEEERRRRGRLMRKAREGGDLEIITQQLAMITATDQLYLRLCQFNPSGENSHDD